MQVQCELCPRKCSIPPGRSGDCRIRVNVNGMLQAVTYGFPCAANVDPVEKKPLYHYQPGSRTFSIATTGCNLHCRNCQNWEISQQSPTNVPAMPLPPLHVVDAAQKLDCPSISFTYSDPVVFYEYTLDTARAARDAGLRSILVTAGYINPEPARELFQATDVARIDLKSISDAFYRDVCGATLKPVLDTITLARELGLHMEIVHLVIPSLNDSDQDLRDLCRWLHRNIGGDVPLHFSAFHPQYRMTHLPPTPVATLRRAREIASAEGILYAYLGNVTEAEGADTQCPSCHARVVRRRGFTVLENKLDAHGRCPACGTVVYGVWQ